MNPTDETLLRTLDAAPPALSAAERDRAQALLERIITTEVPAPNPATFSPPRPRARRTARLRLALVPIAALALAGGLLLAQGSGPGASAYASWTPTPSAADPQSLALADAACRADLRASAGQGPDGPSLDIERASTGLADRRGDFVAIVYWTPNPDLEATCIVHNPPGSDDVDVVSRSGGSLGPAPTTLAADDFVLGGYLDSTGPQPTGLARLFDPGPYFYGSVISGSVGSNVVGLTVHAGTFTTEASIADGRYGAWWPGPAARCGPQKSGVLKCDTLMTYDLHLADGTTTTNASPARPT